MPEPFLLDFAVHHFDLMRYLTGDEAVRVIGQSFRPSWSWSPATPPPRPS